ADLATRAGVEGRQRLRIHTPLIALSKREIILTGLSLGLDYALTSSCYEPAPDGAACGRCDACLLRLKGFTEAGVPDPIRYRAAAAAWSCARAASPGCSSTSPSPPPCMPADSRSRSRRTARCRRHPVSIGCASAPRRESSWCCDAAMS